MRGQHSAMLLKWTRRDLFGCDDTGLDKFISLLGRKETLACIAVAILLILIFPTIFPPSLVVAPIVMNPVGGLASGMFLSCVDSGECRTAFSSMFVGYDVKPDNQFLTASFCSDISFNISVTNPLKSSDIRVLENRISIGEVARGSTNTLTAKIDARKPLDLPELYLTEARSFGIDSEFLRGDSVGEFLDKNKTMGKTIYANISWYPSEEQKNSYDSINALNQSIMMCAAKHISNSAVESKLNESQKRLKSAIYYYKDCNFILSDVRYAAEELTRSCVEPPLIIPVQEKDLFEEVLQYWWVLLILIVAAVLWWILK